MSGAHPNSPLGYSVWDRVKLTHPMVSGDTDGYDGRVPRTTWDALEQARRRHWRRVEAWQSTVDDFASATQGDADATRARDTSGESG